MSSHEYKTLLDELMDATNLSRNSRAMFYDAFRKNFNGSKTEALNRINKFERKSIVQDLDWYDVKTFVMTRITKGVFGVSKHKLFPAAYVSVCTPAFNMMMYCLTTHPNKRTFSRLAKLPGFAQLHLDPEMQFIAKRMLDIHWKKIGDKESMSISTHGNFALDTYQLMQIHEPLNGHPRVYKYKDITRGLVDLQLDSNKVLPEDPVGGYTLEEILRYLKSATYRKADEYNA